MKNSSPLATLRVVTTFSALRSYVVVPHEFDIVFCTLWATVDVPAKSSVAFPARSSVNVVVRIYRENVAFIGQIFHLVAGKILPQVESYDFFRGVVTHGKQTFGDKYKVT